MQQYEHVEQELQEARLVLDSSLSQAPVSTHVR
jgi:hypothetical protein